MRHCIDERRGVVDTEVRAEDESFERLDVDKGIAKDTPVVEVVVLVMVKFAQLVLAVAHATYRSGECCTVLLVNRDGRRHLERVLHRSRIHLLIIR